MARRPAEALLQPTTTISRASHAQSLHGSLSKSHCLAAAPHSPFPENVRNASMPRHWRGTSGDYCRLGGS